MGDENIKKKFVGVWELVYVDSQTIDGKDLNRWNGKGRLIYTEQGYVSAQLGDPKVKSFKSEDKYQGTDKEMRKAFNEFDSYYGTYEIDTENKVVKHHIELSLFPNWNGTIQERTYKFVNDHLELKVINLNRIDVYHTSPGYAQFAKIIHFGTVGRMLKEGTKRAK